jgi:hypothetical protein
LDVSSRSGGKPRIGEILRARARSYRVLELQVVMGRSEVVHAHCQAEDALVRTSFLLTGTRLTGSRYRVRLITMRGQSKTPARRPSYMLASDRFLTPKTMIDLCPLDHLCRLSHIDSRGPRSSSDQVRAVQTSIRDQSRRLVVCKRKAQLRLVQRNADGLWDHESLTISPT